MVGTNTTFIDATLGNNQTAWYYVTATNGAEGSPSNAARATTFTTPSAPRNLIATASLEGNTLVWRAPEAPEGTITQYDVYRASSPSGIFAQIGSTTTASYVDPTITSGGLTYQVRAVNSIGTGVPSNAATPMFLLTALPQDRAVDISWYHPAPAGGFTILKSTDLATYTPLVVLSGDNRTFLDVGLTNGQPFAYQVVHNGVPIAPPVAAIPGSQFSAAGLLNVASGTLGSNGWYRSPITLGFEVNGPTYGSGYHSISALRIVRNETFRGESLYLDEFESPTGWMASSPSVITTPSLSVDTLNVRQGNAALKASVQNDVSSSTSVMPIITKNVNHDLSPYDTLELSVYYLTTSPTVNPTGKIDVTLRDGAAIAFSAPLQTLNVGWNMLSLALGPSGPSRVTSVEFTLHEARKNSIPPSGELQQFTLDGMKAYSSATLTEATEGIARWNFQVTDATGLVQETRHAAFKTDWTPGRTTANATGTLGSNGWYKSAVQISLSANDTASGIASIRYSVGADTMTSYAGPFSITAQGMTCDNYQSTDVAGNVEPRVSDCYFIDMVAPSTSPGLGGTMGTNGWHQSGVMVWLNASDTTSRVAHTNYSIDNGPNMTYTGPFVVSGDNASHVVRFASTDNAGNVEATQSIIIKIDTATPRTTPPSATAGLSGTLGNNGYYVSDVRVWLNATDNTSGVAKTNYSVNGGPNQTYADAFDITTDSMGNLLSFFSLDQAGNKELNQTVSIPIDKTAPITIVSAAGTGTNGWFSGTVHVTVAPADPTSGVSSARYRLDGGAWQTIAAASVSFDVSGEGMHTIEYNATDNAGNIEAIKTTSFKIDNAPPRITSRLPSPGSTVSADQLLRVTYDDLGGAERSGIDPSNGLVAFVLERSLAPTPSTDPSQWVDVTDQGDVSMTSAQTSWTSHTLGGLQPGLYRIRGFVLDQAGNSAAFEGVDVNGWTFNVGIT